MPNPKQELEIRQWLLSRLASYLQIPVEELNIDESLTRLGVDSTEAVVISGELQEWLGYPLSPTVAWDYPTIRELASHLSSQKAG